MSTALSFYGWLFGQMVQTIGNEIEKTDYERTMGGIIEALSQAGLVVKQPRKMGKQNQETIQIRASALIWRLGDGKPKREQLRRHRVQGQSYEEVMQEGNAFFQKFYSGPDTLEQIKHLESKELKLVEKICKNL